MSTKTPFAYKERITKNLIQKALEQHLITVGNTDDLLTAHIGKYWFHIHDEIGKKPTDFSQDQLIHMIWCAINDEPINHDDDECATECLYYKCILKEHLCSQEKNLFKKENLFENKKKREEKNHGIPHLYQR